MKRTPACNMRLASCGVKCLNSSAVFQINFGAVLTVLCPEIPHERQAQDRCAQFCLTGETTDNDRQELKSRGNICHIRFH